MQLERLKLHLHYYHIYNNWHVDNSAGRQENENIYPGLAPESFIDWISCKIKVTSKDKPTITEAIPSPYLWLFSRLIKGTSIACQTSLLSVAMFTKAGYLTVDCHRFVK